VVGKFLLPGLECYKDMQMKADNKYHKYVDYWRNLEVWLGVHSSH